MILDTDGPVVDLALATMPHDPLYPEDSEPTSPTHRPSLSAIRATLRVRALRALISGAAPGDIPANLEWAIARYTEEKLDDHRALAFYRALHDDPATLDDVAVLIAAHLAPVPEMPADPVGLVNEARARRALERERERRGTH